MTAMKWLSRNLRPILAIIGVCSVITAFGLRSIGSPDGGVRHHARDLAGTFDVENVFTQAPRDVDVVGNVTETRGVIFKRNDLKVAPASHDTWHRYRCKGAQHMQLMLEDEAYCATRNVPQEEGNKFADLFDAHDFAGHWTRTIDNPEFDMRRDLPETNDLNCLDHVFGLEKRSYTVNEWQQDDDTWEHHKFVQKDDYGPNLDLKATNAYYEFIANKKGSILIINGARSPKFQIAQMGTAQEPPALKRWSDIAWIFWASVAAGKEEGQANWLGRPTPAQVKGRRYAFLPPHWILVNQIWGPHDTLAVISRCLLLFGWKEPHMPEWKDRIEFPIGSSCYLAILGTVQGGSITYFLAQHKFHGWYEHVPVTITVWGNAKINVGDGAGGPNAPHDEDFGKEMASLLFNIARQGTGGRGSQAALTVTEHPGRPGHFAELTLKEVVAENAAHELSVRDNPMASNGAFENPNPQWKEWPWKLYTVYNDDNPVQPRQCQQAPR